MDDNDVHHYMQYKKIKPILVAAAVVIDYLLPAYKYTRQ